MPLPPIPVSAPPGAPAPATAELPEPIGADGRPLTTGRDPRPDLRGDHHRWETLLELAGEHDLRLHASLHRARAGGARLVSIPQPLDLTPAGPPPYWRLEPGAWPAAAWADFRRLALVPHTALLTQLLTGAAP